MTDREGPAIVALPLHQEMGVNRLMGHIGKLDAEMKIKQWVLEEAAHLGHCSPLLCRPRMQDPDPS